MAPTTYKAVAFVSGRVPQAFYGTDEGKVTLRAISALYSRPWGWASTWPNKVIVYKSIRRLSGNRTLWETVAEIPYGFVPRHCPQASEI